MIRNRSHPDSIIRPILAACLLAGLPAITGCINDLSADQSRLKGYSAMQRGEHEKAREHFQQTLQKNDTDWKSLYYLGRIQLEQFNNPGEARRHLEIAYSVRESRSDIQLAPKPGSARTAVPYPTRTEIAAALAEALHQQGRTEQLFGFLRNVTDNHGTMEDYLLLAQYLEKNGDHDAAQVAYKQAAAVADDGDATGYIALADFYDRIGQPDRALTALRKAYHVDPEARGLEKKIREHGMVPGPTIALPPDQDQQQTEPAPEGAAPSPSETTGEQS